MLEIMATGSNRYHLQLWYLNSLEIRWLFR